MKTMTAQIAGSLGKAAAVAGLAVGLALGSGPAAAEDGCGPDNYFVEHPGPLSGRTGVDPCDPYAPVDLGGAAGASGGADNARAATEQAAATEDTGSGWDVPPMPGLPGQPY